MTTLKFFFSILSLFLIISCSSNTDDSGPITEEMEMEEDIEEEASSNSGLVRSIDNGFEISYEYVDGLVTKATGNDANTDLDIIYTYDINENIISKSISEITPSETYNNTLTYEYDTIGKLISYSSNQTGNVILTYQTNQVIVDFANTQLLLELDTEDRVIRLEANNYYKIFTYDPSGNLILNEEYDSDTNELTKTYEYTYDTNANPFFNQLESIYLSDFIFTFWGSGWSFSDSLYYDFPYLPNNLTSITFTDQQSSTTTFAYAYNTEDQIITAEENDPSDGSVRNYMFTYY